MGKPSTALHRGARKRFGDTAFAITTALATALILSVLAIIVFDVWLQGWPSLSVEFLTEDPQEGMTAGGIFPAIVGTVALVILMTVAVIPVGVATAIYLHEYARPDSLATRAIRVGITNLAGVPSIVFGLFGLGFFIQFVGRGLDSVFSPRQIMFGQPSLLWAAMTLAVLNLPVVIVSTEEALRTVPNDLRQASLALGATRFQTVLHVVLPQSAAGILTGAILAIGRAAAEVSPILFTGVAYFLPRLTVQPTDPFMSLSHHVYALATQSSDVAATRPLLSATVAVLLTLTCALNLSAVVLRARLRRRMA